ncbi:MAG: dTDP-4-dehydrorhamnose 3,5-epimerase [Candidatus Doudnabacteria bacterium]|nr:dTDP-4-dehydrorhamnose 3,5-epimerase [Candidatus Doudnabacteria bacterium]
MPATSQQFEIQGLLLIKSDVYSDNRGYFIESYKKTVFTEFGLPDFVQDNFSFSLKGVLRGLHFQTAPFGQGKLVRAIEGKIWDVGVDIRPGSPTYGKWQGVELAEGDGKAFYVPDGFAHGFVVLSDTAKVMYKTTAEYNPQAEKGIVWNDPDLNIAWPEQNPIVAKRDAEFPKLKDLKI